MEIEIKINDTIFTNFTKFNYKRSMTNFTQLLDFEYIVEEEAFFTKEDKIQVRFDKQLVFDGIVIDDPRSIDFSNNTYKLQAFCKDKFYGFESQISQSCNQTGTVDIAVVIKNIGAELLYDSLDIEAIGVDTKITLDKDFSCDVGSTGLELLKPMLNNAQLLMYSNGFDRIVLTRTSTEQIPNYKLIANKSGIENNVIRVEKLDNDILSYGAIELVYKTDSPNGKKKKSEPESSILAKSFTNGLPNRKKVVVATYSVNTNEADNLIKFLAGNYKRFKSQINITVPSFYSNESTKDYFKINTLIYLECDYLKIKDYMLIIEANFKYNKEQQIYQTDLILVDKSGIDVLDYVEINKK